MEILNRGRYRRGPACEEGRGFQIGRDIPTWSNSIKKYLAPMSASNCLEALQYGQYDLLNITIPSIHQFPSLVVRSPNAERAVLTNGILINDSLGLGLCGGHSGG